MVAVVMVSELVATMTVFMTKLYTIFLCFSHAHQNHMARWGEFDLESEESALAVTDL